MTRYFFNVCDGFFRNPEFDAMNPDADYDDEIYGAENTRGTTGKNNYYRYKLKVIKYIWPNR